VGELTSSRLAPVVFAAGVLLAAVGWIIFAGIRLAGAFAYPLDDTYIHMAVARHLIDHGTWGVNAGVSTSASSSPVWTLVLSGAAALGLPLDYAPLILSVAGGIAVIVAADALLRDAGMTAWPRALALVVLLALGFVPTLSVLGMEHTWHAALSLGFLLALRRCDEPRWRTVLLVLAAILPLVRFESLVFVGLAIPMVWLSSRRDAVRLAAVTALPVGVFMLISAANGWLWLPNSVLVKLALDAFHTPPLLERVRMGRSELVEAAGYAAAIGVLQFSGVLTHRLKREAVVVLGTTFVHAAMTGPGLGTINRYVGYLLAMLLVTMLSAMSAAAASTWRSRTRRADMTVAFAIAILVSWMQPAWERARDRFSETPLAIRNISDQQQQSARFVRDFLTVPGPVMINDLGYVAYSGGRDVIDIVGLGDTAFARRFLAREMDAAALSARAAASGTQVAVVYEYWLANDDPDLALPRDWIPIGTWTIDDNVICGSETVTVFATQPGAAGQLRDDFRRFSATLPGRTQSRLVTGPWGNAGAP
jgi:hypothetical protein